MATFPAGLDPNCVPVLESNHSWGSVPDYDMAAMPVLRASLAALGYEESSDDEGFETPDEHEDDQQPNHRSVFFSSALNMFRG